MRPVEQCLRAGLALQCAGAVGSILSAGTPLNTLLFLKLGFADATVRMIDRGIAGALICAAVAVLFSRQRILFWVIAGWFAIEALLSGYLGGFFAASLAPFARGVRYLVPIALIALISGDEKRAEKLIAWGACFVFAAHGIEAVLMNPRFVDYLIVTVDRISGLRMVQSAAEAQLIAIGLIDLALALLVVRKPNKHVWLYMAFWGLTTALMRSIYFGPELGWHHTLIRALNGGAPLALLLLAARTPVIEMEERWPEPSSSP